jgi:hypothetical protein
MNFISLDFETANPSRVSICAVGLTVFENGPLTEVPYWLVRPPKGHDLFRHNHRAVMLAKLRHLDIDFRLIPIRLCHRRP